MVGGNILMAIPVLRRRVSPRWIGFVLIGSAVMSVVYLAAALTPPNVVVSLVGGLGPILLCVALGCLGYLGASDTRTLHAQQAAGELQRA
jgi:Flp pilus assembly protein protease CpaA